MKKIVSLLLGLSVLCCCASLTLAQGMQELVPYNDFNFKRGFVNTAGEVVIEAQWDDVRPFREGFASVESGGKWGFIDTTGRVISEPHGTNFLFLLKGLRAFKKMGSGELLTQQEK